MVWSQDLTMSLSSLVHWVLWGDHRMSVCGRALEKCDQPFWRAWVRVWGVGHCLGSWMNHKLRE
jgi:hypothetical protein